AYFQNFVLFTNYQFYVDEFCARARALMASGNSDYDALVEPGNRITRRGDNAPPPAPAGGVRLPQMPAYHLVRPNHSGIRWSISASVPPTPRPSPTTSPCCAPMP